MTIEWHTIRPERKSAKGDSEQVLTEAVVNSRPLRGFLEAAVDADQPILLCVNDSHRSTQTKPALRALIKFIGQLREHDGGWRGRRSFPRFRVLFATGTHRFSEAGRSTFERETLADTELNAETVTWHDATEERNLVSVGGARMHRLIGESRFILPVGSVEPHYFGGATGPHKTVTIGCLSRDDIEQNHAGALSPASDLLRLRGNPVYDGIVQVLGGLSEEGRRICAIGEVVCDDAVVAAAVGDPIEVTDELLPTARQTYVRTIERPVDVLRLRVPPPLGRSLYQADKALKNNHLAVRDGGAILLEAECDEGIGPDAFMRLLRRSNSYAEATSLVDAEGYRLGDHKAVKLRYLMDPACRGVYVELVSTHVSKADLADTGIEVVPTTDVGLKRAGEVTSRSLPSAMKEDGPPGGPYIPGGGTRSGLVVEDAGMVCVTSAWQ
ncbi:MAG: lactate racemase domain-containing protein [Phycisphaerae bacterium]|jgi:nickel-dependent lactate racemase